VKRLTPSEPDAGSELDTRERILEVAAKLFAKQGYDGTSVRDIAKELGIANPSIYYHFKSKVDILIELLREPLKTVELAVAEAKKLSGEAKIRRILEGLLDALEVHQGVVLTVPSNAKKLATPHQLSAFEAMPKVISLISETTAKDNREVRITMAIGAVEGIVRSLRSNSADTDTVIKQLRKHRKIILELVLKILRS
jgi:AcrR family transcriptional regulator